MKRTTPREPLPLGKKREGAGRAKVVRWLMPGEVKKKMDQCTYSKHEVVLIF
jgi:hypothetical protein